MPPDDSRPATYRDLLVHESQQAGIPPELALAVADQESAGRQGATSSVGARGIFQLMPETAKRLGVDPSDPVGNIKGGVALLKELNAQYHGDVNAILSGYFGGQNPANHGPLTEQYVRQVNQRLQTALQAKQQIGQPPPGPTSPYLAGQTPTPTVTPGQIPPPQAPPDQPGMLAKFGKAAVDTYNPWQREGRQNLAGAAGGAAAGVAGAYLGVPPYVAAPIGAGLVSGAEDYIDSRFFQGESDPMAHALRTAGSQGALDVMGQGIGLSVAAPAKRVMGSRIAAATAAKLEAGLAAAKTLVGGARVASRVGVDAAQDAAAAGVSGARTAAKSSVDAAQAAADAQIAQARAPHDQLVAQAPSAVAAGKQSLDVLKGPSKAGLDELGQAVGAAAETGPAKPAQPLRDKLAELSAQITPLASHQADQGTLSVSGNMMSADQIAQMAQKNPQGSAFLQQALTQQLPPNHPLPRVLGEIEDQLAQSDTIPYADLHKMKVNLDAAVNWDRAAKKPAEQITKGFRSTLRQTMAGHAPYDSATAAYAVAAPNFSKGMVPRIRQLSIDQPEAIVGMISDKQPTRLQMYKNALFTHVEGGDTAQAQQAFDRVRQAWTDRKIIQGGPEKYVEKLDKLDPDFRATMFGADPAGQQIEQNLRDIGAAYQKAIEDGRIQVENVAAQGKQTVEAAKLAGQRGVRQAAQTGREQVTAAQAGVKSEQQTADAFAQSSLARKKGQLAGGDVADTLRFLALGPTKFWGAMSGYRLMRGPRGRDLVTWAAYSGKDNTKRLVQALNAGVPGLALTNLERMAGFGTAIDQGLGGAPKPVPSHDSTQVGTPPPTLTRRLPIGVNPDGSINVTLSNK